MTEEEFYFEWEWCADEQRYGLPPGTGRPAVERYIALVLAGASTEDRGCAYLTLGQPSTLELSDVNPETRLLVEDAIREDAAWWERLEDEAVMMAELRYL